MTALMDELENLLRALGELAGAQRPALETNPRLLYMLEREWKTSPDNVFRAIYETVEADLVTEGMDGYDASRVAVRITRLAFLLLELRLSMSEATEVLTISKRTGSYDVVRLRSVLRDGKVRAAAERQLPPVPVPTGDRVSVRALPARTPGRLARRPR